MSTTKMPPVARLRAWVTKETIGGLLLLSAAALALIWANSPWRDSYHSLAEYTVGPAALHLNLDLATWAADGLLAIFFFIVGAELKHEIVDGSLSNPREAAVPMIAAVGGMAVPAVLYVVMVTALGDASALHGWAIPTATDIAFALAVLAIFGRGLPRGLRTFLLTLAVVDDLLAIIVIAAFYTESIGLTSLAIALVCVAAFAFVARSKFARWWILLPIAVVAWSFMHASGVHATIAGVLMGLSLAAKPIHGESAPRTHRYDDIVRPFSAGIALPLFAFFAAGVTFVAGDGIGDVLSEPVLIAIVVALVLGKVIGVLGAATLLTKLTPMRLPDAIGLRDLLPVGLLCGIGFTVSLLIAELSFPDTEHTDAGKLGILLGTLIAATAAAIMLRWDARKARHRDMNEDGLDDADISRIGDE
ncbi:Na+/H+ antiporter NhaA [Cumulibacter soli]|uniref:Na+/H+ antiporter NhaA n=1 Tax=Cumulibacter soli TaxID=2546344 RepID=UPI001068253A|nr:Na+/H+ antiporter NhaA [Cumulibacter soli]